MVGEIGVAGPVLVLDLGIVLGALVGVLDQQRDRRAGGLEPSVALVLEDAREDVDRVVLAALRGEARLAGLAAIEIALDHLGRQIGNARRAAIDHDAQRRPVAFTPGGEAEQMAEGVEAHGSAPEVAGVLGAAARASIEPVLEVRPHGARCFRGHLDAADPLQWIVVVAVSRCIELLDRPVQ